VKIDFFIGPFEQGNLDLILDFGVLRALMQTLCQIVELKPYINLLTASTATILNDFELFDILGLRAPYKPSGPTVPLNSNLHKST
jgi:hypothetical protein